ncbi:MAG: ABC transporter ATP-binding protein [Candidatus Vogelbacteria bacterium]|nr:ABC transporter ATP-binding protein [Candidatus Vogelbacteria bacterium]
MIKAEKLVKSYHNGEADFKVLKGLDFEVSEGEFVTITGRSGSGKSTLLYQLGLLDHPTSGAVFLDGINTAELDRVERIQFRLNKLGYIFQDYAILPDLSAVENVMLPLLMQGLDQFQAHAKAAVALERVQMGHRLDNLPSQMSGGEQQRVSIARALAHAPKIMFADEPTANLDSETSEVIMQTFIDLNKAGQTIVMVTHEPEYAEIGHRTITLSDGVIVDTDVNKII